MLRIYTSTILQLLIIINLTSALPPRRPIDHQNPATSWKETSSLAIPDHSMVCAMSRGSTTCGQSLKITVENCRSSCACSASGRVTCTGNDDCNSSHLESFCDRLCICGSPPLQRPDVPLYAPRIIKAKSEIESNHRASSHLYLGEPGTYYDDDDDNL